METFCGCGDGTHNHLSQTSNNITGPLDIILKDKEILSYEGPTAFKCDWKQSTPHMQTSNSQILAHHQHNTETCIRNSSVSFHIQSGQSTAVLPRKNYPQHESKHFCSNDTPETSATGEQHVLKKCPSSSSFEHQSASSFSTTTNMSQQSMPHMIVLNTNNLSRSWNSNLHNEQQHVKITNNLLKDSICEGLPNVGHFDAILAQAQTIKLCQQNAKDIYSQKYAPQKAIAVVTPLTQQVVGDVMFTKNPTKVKEGGLGTVPNKDDHQPYILYTLQPATTESGVKTLYYNTSKTKEVPSKSVLTTGRSHYVKDDGPVENNTLPGQNERLSSDPLKSIERKEAVQPYPTDNNGNARFLRDDATIMDGNSDGTGTRMDARVDHLFATTVNEWSLQKLRNLVIDLEETQKKQQKDIPFNDLFSEILKMYWNGDYKKLRNAAKSNIYISIMQEVRLHCGTENSLILHEFSTERLNEIASRFHILEHGIAPPKMVYTSSWLNLSETLCDIDKDDDWLLSLMTIHHKPKIAEREVPMKMETMQEPTTEKIRACNKALSGGEKQSKPLPPEHQRNSTAEGEIIVRKEPVVMDVENTCTTKETEGQDGMTVKNVKMKRAQSETQKTNSENEASLLVSSSTESSDVNGSCIKPGNLLKLPTTDMTPLLDKNGFADCISVKMTTIPPEKSKEPGEEVNNMQKGDAQILTESKGQVTVELIDMDKTHMDAAIKSDERSNRIKISWQLENYCCLAKWFQVLGYRNRGLCKCEKNVELSRHADNGVKEENVDKHRHPFNKDCKLTDTDICVLRDNSQAKNGLGCRSMIGKKSIISSIEDASMDELEIVDVVTNYEDVLNMANAMSKQLMEMPLIPHTSYESTTGRKHHRDHKKVTMPEFKTGDAQINLTLFGTSQLRQKKSISGFTSLENVYLPPETINVRIGSGWNEFPNNTKSQTLKQKVWNSWKKSYVPSKMSAKKRSMKQEPAKEPETAVGLIATLQSHEQDTQSHPSEAKFKNAFFLASADKQKNIHTDHSKKKSRKKNSSTRRDKVRKLKRSKDFASFHLKKRWNYANNGRKLMKSSCDLAQDINTSKNKLNTDSALNFGVLPESFIISDSNSSMEANPSASADSGSKDKTVMQIKRTWGMSGAWCDSPRKKQCLKSTPTLTNSSGPSSFQEFKKKYEEKKQRLLS